VYCFRGKRGGEETFPLGGKIFHAGRKACRQEGKKEKRIISEGGKLSANNSKGDISNSRCSEGPKRFVLQDPFLYFGEGL